MPPVTSHLSACIVCKDILSLFLGLLLKQFIFSLWSYRNVVGPKRKYIFYYIKMCTYSPAIIIRKESSEKKKRIHYVLRPRRLLWLHSLVLNTALRQKNGASEERGKSVKYADQQHSRRLLSPFFILLLVPHLRYVTVYFL